MRWRKTGSSGLEQKAGSWWIFTAPLRKAFTLIEMLVTVGVITILAGILLPTISRAREYGKRTDTLGNTRSLIQAIQIYGNNSLGNAYPVETISSNNLIRNRGPPKVPMNLGYLFEMKCLPLNTEVIYDRNSANYFTQTGPFGISMWSLVGGPDYVYSTFVIRGIEDNGYTNQRQADVGGRQASIVYCNRKIGGAWKYHRAGRFGTEWKPVGFTDGSVKGDNSGRGVTDTDYPLDGREVGFWEYADKKL